MRIEIVTVTDLEIFKRELLDEIRLIVGERKLSTKKWLKTKEVLTLLKVSPGKLQAMRTNRILPYTPIGGVFYYDQEDVQKLLEDNKKI